MINIELNYLKELGYSEDEISEYAKSWNNGIISYLAENSENVSRNMTYLMNELDKDILLKFPVFYSSTFTISPELFEERMMKLKSAFPDEWVDIIEKQFWGYDGIKGTDYEPIMRSMGSYDDSDVEKAIEQFKNPQSITFEFIVLLSERIGISLSAEDFPEYSLLDLEVAKYEVVRNAEYLTEAGLPMELVKRVICNAPYLMMLSELEVQVRLSEGFGENFISRMQELDEDSFYEALDGIAW